ncbi:MAG: response regulator, partial [Calditrichia bacterium]
MPVKEMRIFPENEAETIFENWILEVEQLSSLIHYDAKLDLQKLRIFFDSLLDSFAAKPTYLHFQLLQEFLADLTQRRLSTAVVNQVLCALRSLLMQSLIQSISIKNVHLVQKHLQTMINGFDELFSFVHRYKNLELADSPGTVPGDVYTTGELQENGQNVTDLLKNAVPVLVKTVEELSSSESISFIYLKVIEHTLRLLPKISGAAIIKVEKNELKIIQQKGFHFSAGVKLSIAPENIPGILSELKQEGIIRQFGHKYGIVKIIDLFGINHSTDFKYDAVLIFQKKDICLLLAVIYEGKMAPNAVEILKLFAQEIQVLLQSYINRHKIKAGRHKKQIFGQKKSEEKRVSENIDIIAAGISYDIRIICDIIHSTADMIKDSPAEFSNKRRAEIIQKMVKRADLLSDHLNKLAHLQPPVLEKVDLNSLTESIVKELFHHTSGFWKIRLEADAGLPAITGSTTHFHQIISELLRNAKEALPAGGEIQIHMQKITADNYYWQLDPSFKPGEYLQFSVSDSGSGINPEIRDRIFEPMFSFGKKGNHPGMGLSLVYGLTKFYKGVILVKSQPTTGSIFEVFFPLSVKKYGKKRNTAGPINAKEHLIMAVEEDPDLREILKAILLHQNYRVITAAGGKEALEKYQKNGADIDLLLLSINLSDIDGSAFFRRIKEINPAVKAFICSPYSDREEIQKMIRQGIAGVIIKPYTL